MDLEARLRNWGRWARGGIKLQTCGSAEKFFRSNWRQWTTLQDMPYSTPMDVFDAEEVERAWRTLPSKHKKLLKLRYIWKLPANGENFKTSDGRDILGIAARLRIRLHTFDAMFAAAHNRMRLSLERTNVQSKMRLTSISNRDNIVSQFEPLPFLG